MGGYLAWVGQRCLGGPPKLPSVPQAPLCLAGQGALSLVLAYR